MDVLTIEGICKKYDEFSALTDISLSVQKGEAVAIIGSSGSGKSTLLRCVNNLESVQEGSIAIDGEYFVRDGLYESDKELRRICTKTGMVFQHFNLFEHLTALDNIILAPMRILGKSKEEATKQGRALLAEVGLEDKEESLPAQLSGGQQQRVAIARALAMNPAIMLFDEPTSALDPEIIGEVTNVIYGLVKKETTMLIVTHDMSFAREATSRVIYMDKGFIVEEGPPDQLFTNPQTPRLKEFLSSVRGEI